MGDFKSAVFLDRDGVLIEECHYLHSPHQICLIPGAAKAIAALNRAGWAVVIVTNQSGVARGLFSMEAVNEVHDHLNEMLLSYGAHVDGIYFCPHHPAAEVAEYRCECACRKPNPGMLLQAAKELEIDLRSSWMIGDRVSDLAAGGAAGCRTALVRTGYGGLINTRELDSRSLNLELIGENLAEVTARIVEN